MILLYGSVLLVLLLLYMVKKYQFAEQNLAPGPFRLPLLGTLFPFLMNGPTLPWKALDKLAQKHGDFMSMSIGTTYLLILNSYEGMQELMQKEEWSAKLNHYIMKIRSFNQELGLAFVGNPIIWHEMRKFSQRTLRDFGFGKRLSMHGVIELELIDTISEMKEDLKKTNGILLIDGNFTLSVINILWSMITGIRYSHDDPKLQKLLTLTFLGAKKSTFCNPMLAFPKLLNFTSKIIPKYSIQNWTSNFFQQLHDMVKSLIDERRQIGDYLTEPQNYIDVFLRKIKETEKDPASVYTEEQLIIMVEDFWLVGSMTTSATLSYAILFLVMHPDIQRKVQEEIDHYVPRHSIPTIEDIEKMPYTQATILEVHRLGCVVPVPIPRKMEETIKYNGWTIPKDTIIFSNHWAVLMDKNYWGDPENFRPERFINDRGEYIPDRRVIHFGFGKRYCIGVTLVNSVIPIFVSTLLQKFTMSLVEGEKPPNMHPNVGLNLTPYPFNVQVHLRE